MSGDQVNAMKSQPQPRIMAPTRDDVLNNLQYFFGAPVSPEKLKDYQEHHAMCAARTHSATTAISRQRTRTPERSRGFSPPIARAQDLPLPGCESIHMTE